MLKQLLLVSLLAGGVCWAQAGDNFKPALTNVPDAEYPRVGDSGRVEFRLKAADAKTVQVKVGAIAAIDMIKADDGTWTVTTPPIVPGFHYYYFVTDGVTVDDSASRTYYGVWKDSRCHDQGPDPDYRSDIPHRG